MFKIFKKKDCYIEETQIRPWVIEQYNKLKLADFSHNEILNVLSLNDNEKELLEKENNTFNEVVNVIDKAFKETKPVKVKEEKENDKVIDAEIVKETKPVKVKEVKENDKVIDAEIVKETVVEEEPVKESVVEEDPSKWTDEEVIEKALHDLTDKMEYQDKEQMSNLLRESFNSDKQLVDLYRNKYLSHYKLVNNNLSNNDNKSTENKEEGGEKEDKKEVIESKEEKVINEDKDNNKINDLNIDNEMFEMLVDDVFDQYKMIFNIKKDKLKDLIKKVLQEKPEILKSTNYYFVCMRLCEIIENLIMENTIEDNEEDDELLNQLNSLVD